MLQHLIAHKPDDNKEVHQEARNMHDVSRAEEVTALVNGEIILRRIYSDVYNGVDVEMHSYIFFFPLAAIFFSC
ncbi:MAG: hypothetical protein JRN02_04895 [Nitrososphaerota archaeon]|nr:hypothetical protein [Nitrososphaerota archaeon]